MVCETTFLALFSAPNDLSPPAASVFSNMGQWKLGQRNRLCMSADLIKGVSWRSRLEAACISTPGTIPGTLQVPGSSELFLLLSPPWPESTCGSGCPVSFSTPRTFMYQENERKANRLTSRMIREQMKLSVFKQVSCLSQTLPPGTSFVIKFHRKILFAISSLPFTPQRLLFFFFFSDF